MPVPCQTESSDRHDHSESPTPGPAPGRPRRSSQRKRRWIIAIGVFVLLGVAAVGVYSYWQSRYYESTDDAYLEGHPVGVSARVSGNVVAVHVQDNQHVPPRRNEELVQQGAVTEQALEHSRAAAATAQANLDAQEKNLASVRAQTAVARVAVEAAHLQLSYTDIHAPQAGFVTQKSVAVGLPTTSVGAGSSSSICRSVCFPSFSPVLDKGQREDWFASRLILVTGALALVCVSVLIVWELFHEAPIMNLRLLRDRNFAEHRHRICHHRVGTLAASPSEPVGAQPDAPELCL